MSHFLKPSEVRGSRQIGKRHAAVKVLARSSKGIRTLTVEPGILIANADTQVVPLPDDVMVTAGGEPIQWSEGKRFFVSVETFDPYHLVLELTP